MSSAHQQNAPATSESTSSASNSETSFETSGPGNAALQEDAGLVCQDVPPDGGLDGPAQSWDAAAVDLWMQPDEGEQAEDDDLPAERVLDAALFAVNQVTQGLQTGVNDWAHAMQRPDPLPWYSDWIGDAVDELQGALTETVTAALSTVPGGALLGFLAKEALKSVASSLKGSMQSAVGLQEGDEMSEATIVAIAREVQTAIGASGSFLGNSVLKEKDPKKLRAYAEARKAPYDALVQAGLTSATTAWLRYAQKARLGEFDPGSPETPLPDASTVVNVTFTVADDGSVTFDGARISGLPEALRLQLQGTKLGDLPFVARSTGRGAAGIVIEQTIAGAIADRSEVYARPALVRIAERYGRASASDGVSIVAQQLQRATPDQLGLKLEGAN